MQIAKPSYQITDRVLEDLMGRGQACLDQENVRNHTQGKVVMVTGAAGSIGAELCRQIAGFGPLALVGFDQAETALFELGAELEQRFPKIDFRSEIGNITRFDHVSRAMRQYQPAIVFHAAAYKHVPMLERHLSAAVENNIFGTLQVAEAAASHGVESFVMISTDKAVRPASVLGVTKRVAELTIRALQKSQGTKFTAVRFGNVLGSNGSVVPIFKRQIAAGGPVTVTDPGMTRYFMTASEAGQLALQALALGKGGEIFVLDMREPVKVVDLARNLILSSGLEPDRDIKIEFIGVRPGEKLFEELILENDQLVSTSHPKISSLVRLQEADAGRIKALLRELKQCLNAHNKLRMILLLKELVPDYIPSAELLKDAMSTRTGNDVEAAWKEAAEPAMVSVVPADGAVVCAAPGKV